VPARISAERKGALRYAYKHERSLCEGSLSTERSCAPFRCTNATTKSWLRRPSSFYVDATGYSQRRLSYCCSALVRRWHKATVGGPRHGRSAPKADLSRQEGPGRPRCPCRSPDEGRTLLGHDPCGALPPARGLCIPGAPVDARNRGGRLMARARPGGPRTRADERRWVPPPGGGRGDGISQSGCNRYSQSAATASTSEVRCRRGDYSASTDKNGARWVARETEFLVQRNAFQHYRAAGYRRL
jgi:hypothetical protein